MKTRRFPETVIAMLFGVGEINWTDEALRDSVDEFLHLWERRPLRPNPQGMEINHSWATWFILRTLRPNLVVESGVWRGHSTWLIEQSLPEAQIMSFDVNLSRRTFISERSSYFEHDLVFHDWTGISRDDCIFFLDDHQDALQRMKDLHWLGFKRMIFEDNYYPVGSGDFYDLNCLRNGSAWPPARPLPSPLTPSGMRRRVGNFLRNRFANQGGLRGRTPANSPDWVNARPRIAKVFQFPPLQLTSERARDYQAGGGKWCVGELLPNVRLGKDDVLSYNGLTYVELE